MVYCRMAGCSGDTFSCEPLLQHELHLNNKVQSAKSDCKLGLHSRGKCVGSIVKSTIYIPRVDTVI